MGKLKTHKGTAKRVKITATGRVKRSKAYHSHILTKKTRKRKRQLRKATLVSKGEEKVIRHLLPYGF